MKGAVAAFSLTAVCLGGLAGCKVQVNKSANGDDQEVKIATPLGGINVKTNQTDATDLGLPAYPGAQLLDDKGDKSANVDMGFGGWQLRVKVVSYRSLDSRDQVIAFYRKALSSYGDVIECEGDKAVGAPSRTSEGLTCGNDGRPGSHDRIGNSELELSDLQLKAGSLQHQHIVAFKGRGESTTRFALIALDLPHAVEGGKQETN